MQTSKPQQLSKKKPSKEEVEERARNKAHKQKLKQLREQDLCPDYEENEDEGLD